MIQENNSVRYIFYKTHFMGYQQHGVSLGSCLFDGIQYLTYQLRIQGRGGLIQKKQLWLHSQRSGDRHTLLLTAGHMSGVMVGMVIQPYIFQLLYSHLFGLLLRHLPHYKEPLHNIFQGCFPGKKIEILE